MIASGLSELELRSIVERAFLPLRCTCTIANEQMNVQISDPVSGRTQRQKSLPLSRINTVRDISALVAELREEPVTTRVAKAYYSAA
ncbi:MULTISPECIES: DUF1652 domain-containing protein [Pseudomonas]|uniref:DUF1652 domain-containing protein n=8 Tax=Pseudomonas TaxID=286 RepID=A0AAJ4B2L5_PSESX|nr:MULTISPECIES: DUF1652 domain-containing protein [Pseudomonas]MCW6055656.1 DUF1652 domain-containing protein [Pseudomonas fragi]AAY38374.1 conserved hypothetical protein [Pseudomonas syringae pv. syringae B728a]AKF46917.1 Protein of unknown function (DUF1652) [Pseudomonas syringae pv. syringae B301D]AVB26680.1 DUF1652 domain-containing protein [Pseudomonas syringae pv. syringae]EGH72158.1 hypothetical protein PSYAR_16515 [Pseudomonas syringae pv. aceris str. M302273]